MKSLTKNGKTEAAKESSKTRAKNSKGAKISKSVSKTTNRVAIAKFNKWVSRSYELKVATG